MSAEKIGGTVEVYPLNTLLTRYKCSFILKRRVLFESLYFFTGNVRTVLWFGVLCFAFFYASFKYPEILHPIALRRFTRRQAGFAFFEEA
jgi:hypothetical protein